MGSTTRIELCIDSSCAARLSGLNFHSERMNKTPMSSTELPGSRFGEWISEGWKMFTEQWKAWVLLALGYFAVMLLPSVAVMFAAFSAAFASAATQTGPYG